jgi:hypothetical protein
MHTPVKDNLILQLTFQVCACHYSLYGGVGNKAQIQDAQPAFQEWYFHRYQCTGSTRLGEWADFLHKMKIAYKKAEETQYWPELCLEAENYLDTNHLLRNLASIPWVPGKIISSLKAIKPSP